MQLSHLIQFLNEIAPEQFQESYDNAGLITGHPDMTIQGVLVTLDCIESIVDEAIELGCNVIVAHHPIVFSGLKRLNGYNYVERTIIKAIKHDIAIYAIHTNLDNVFLSGVNTKISDKLALHDIEILAPKPDIIYKNYPVGAGMTGYLPAPMEPELFFEYVKDKMELKVFKHTAICKDKILKVALCGGSGGFLLQQSIRSGADVFITSDYKYHEFFDADGKIIIIDTGHFESEKFTIDLLYDLIVNNFSTFATHYTNIITNPINFY
ncbi:MAG TPA: Nif3-like dinuclear metal center hexameric protein [Saprospiraceae bacterium]|jgi:dinuclear metal center YbgI/SA1388 family protein|nr:Nif3-like dinuclear metal center hexameric protein [Saprospiraceae bacterium]HRO08065.1 Nif3-like dinuclear metal center hexameric protein [Saprospiraceae bacterium]HRP41348.1 Nif3-like dinuclear metal center hexameric protein [Saprospiraceae bacterium]